MMACFDSSFLCASAGAESFHHYLLIGENLHFLSPLSSFSLFASSIPILPLGFPISLYACMVGMDCFWYSQSFREHVIVKAATRSTKLSVSI
uniref:Uncharacterized protein n=1 Tax=Setaria italica TaxID=4555 RepID=K4AH79_SETIT